MTAAGVIAFQPRLMSSSAICSIRPRPIITTTVALWGARLSRIGRYASSAWPETTTKPDDMPRWVTGMPASAAAAIAELTPGTTSNEIPAAASASRFFSTAAEHERVAALEAHDPLPGAGGADHQPVDELLPDLRAARALADEHALRRRRQRERCRIDERVVEHEVRVAEAIRGLPRQQVGVARACADE